MGKKGHEPAISRIIRQSGCADIQEAIRVMEEGGFSPDSLDPDNAREVLAVMASAKTWGAQAAPRPQAPPPTRP
jgi:hypothetical protein